MSPGPSRSSLIGNPERRHDGHLIGSSGGLRSGRTRIVFGQDVLSDIVVRVELTMTDEAAMHLTIHLATPFLWSGLHCRRIVTPCQWSQDTGSLPGRVHRSQAIAS